MRILLIFGVISLSLISGCGGGSSSSNSTSDKTSPTILSFTPTDNATNIELNAKLTVTFNEAMLATSIDNTSIVLTNNQLSMAPVVATVSYDGNNLSTLTPNAPLSLLTNYSAKVTKAVADLAGNSLKTEKQWRFTTRDGVWKPSLPIVDSEGASGYKVVADSLGNVITVWKESHSIHAIRYTPSGGWNNTEIITTSSGDSIGIPDIAINPSGQAVVVWSQNNNLYAKHFDPANGWGNVLINIDSVSGKVITPKVAISQSGNAITVWSHVNTTGIDIRANLFTPFTGWTSSEKLENHSGGAFSPQIAIDASGNAIAVWFSSFGNLWANHYTSANGWNRVATPIEESDEASSYPELAMNSSGNAMVVWKQGDNGNLDLWAKYYDVVNGWSGGKIIESSTNKVVGGNITIDPSGNAIAAWAEEDQDQINLRIWVNRYSNNKWSGAEEIASNDLTSRQKAPVIASDPSGNAIIAWETAASGRKVDTSRFNFKDGTWSDKVRLGDGAFPSITIDSSGKATVIYSNSRLSTKQFE